MPWLIFQYINLILSFANSRPKDEIVYIRSVYLNKFLRYKDVEGLQNEKDIIFVDGIDDATPFKIEEKEDGSRTALFLRLMSNERNPSPLNFVLDISGSTKYLIGYEPHGGSNQLFEIKSVGYNLVKLQVDLNCVTVIGNGPSAKLRASSGEKCVFSDARPESIFSLHPPPNSRQDRDYDNYSQPKYSSRGEGGSYGSSPRYLRGDEEFPGRFPSDGSSRTFSDGNGNDMICRCKRYINDSYDNGRDRYDSRRNNGYYDSDRESSREKHENYGSYNKYNENYWNRPEDEDRNSRKNYYKRKKPIPRLNISDEDSDEDENYKSSQKKSKKSNSIFQNISKEDCLSDPNNSPNEYFDLPSLIPIKNNRSKISNLNGQKDSNYFGSMKNRRFGDVDIPQNNVVQTCEEESYSLDPLCHDKEFIKKLDELAQFSPFQVAA